MRTVRDRATPIERLELSGELTVLTAAATKDVVLDFLAAYWRATPDVDAGGAATGATLHVDLDGVVDLDCAGVQVLLLARREANRHGRLLDLIHAGDEVRASLTMVGIPEADPFPEAMPTGPDLTTVTGVR